jgi:hypothetical protein
VGREFYTTVGVEGVEDGYPLRVATEENQLSSLGLDSKGLPSHQPWGLLAALAHV